VNFEDEEMDGGRTLPSGFLMENDTLDELVPVSVIFLVVRGAKSSNDRPRVRDFSDISLQKFSC